MNQELGQDRLQASLTFSSTHCDLAVHHIEGLCIHVLHRFLFGVDALRYK